ncbi:DUF2255 family protein [Lactococcus cremoris]
MAVAAGRGMASSWWNSAMISKKVQVHIDGKVYQVEFEPVTDKVSLINLLILIDNVQAIAGILLGRKILDRQ